MKKGLGKTTTTKNINRRKGMTAFRAMISNNTGVSSNRFINVIMVIFMLAVMVYSLFFAVPIEILETILQYSLYIFVSSLGTKAAEKITSIIKQKGGSIPKEPEI